MVPQSLSALLHTALYLGILTNVKTLHFTVWSPPPQVNPTGQDSTGPASSWSLLNARKLNWKRDSREVYFKHFLLSPLNTRVKFWDRRMTSKSFIAMLTHDNWKALVQHSEDQNPQLALFCQAIVSGTHNCLVHRKTQQILQQRCSTPLVCVDIIQLVTKSCCQHNGIQHKSRICYLCAEVIWSNLLWYLLKVLVRGCC